MSFSNAGSGSPTPQMNVTPLIDVLLVLMIVFMVVVSMTNEKGLEARIPQPSQEKTQLPSPESTIVVQVAWTGANTVPSLKINQDNVKWGDLQARLREIFAPRAQHVAFVRGDDDVDFVYVANVIDIAKSAGVEKVGLMTKE